MRKTKVGHIIDTVCGVALVCVGVWFVVSCMQVSNQNVAWWNLIELLF